MADRSSAQPVASDSTGDQARPPAAKGYPLAADVLRPSLVGDLAAILAGACLIGLLSQVVIGLPGEFAPITGMSLAVLLVGALGGAYRGMMSVLAWAVAGFAGMPWFIYGNSGFDLLNDLTDILVLVVFLVVAGVVGLLARRGWTASVGRSVLLGVLGLLLIDLLTAAVVMLAQAPLGQALYESAVRQLPADVVRLAVFVAVVWVANRFGVAAQEARPAPVDPDSSAVGAGVR